MSYRHSMSLLIRTDVEPHGLLAAVRNEVAALDPRLPVFNVRTLDEQVRDASAQERAAALLTSLFGALALLLAAIGIYGVMAYAVAQRTHEIGLRMALGAQAGDVLKLVVRQGLSLALTGVGLGTVAALSLTRLIVSQLYGMSAIDPTTFGGSAALLLGVVVLACYLPARQATKVDPLIALKYE
jgi:putative ABC transport system permease protein